MDGSVWVILPTYDEAENLEAVVGGIRAALPEAHDPRGRRQLARRHRAARRGDGRRGPAPPRQGRASGCAYIAGFAHALDGGAGYVVEMDADLSHDPADLPRLVEPALDGADLVLGSRYVAGGGIENWGLERRVLSRARLRATRAACWACRCATSPAASSASARARCGRSSSRAPVATGLRVPGRADLAGAHARPAGDRGADPLPRAALRRVEDVRAHRARGGVAGSGAALRVGGGGVRRYSRTPQPADPLLHEG